MSIATIYYKPGDQPITDDQLRAGLKLLTDHLDQPVSGTVQAFAEHPGDPPSSCLVDPAYGADYVLLDREVRLIDLLYDPTADVYITVDESDGGLTITS